MGGDEVDSCMGILYPILIGAVGFIFIMSGIGSIAFGIRLWLIMRAMVAPTPNVLHPNLIVATTVKPTYVQPIAPPYYSQPVELVTL